MKEYIPHENKRYLGPRNQHDLNDLTRYIGISKESVQLLWSRLAERQMLLKRNNTFFVSKS